MPLLLLSALGTSTGMCLQLEVSLGVEKPPQNMHLQALVCRSPSLGSHDLCVTTSCHCVSGKAQCLFPGSGTGSQGWLQALKLEPEPSLGPSTSSQLQL